MTDSGCAEISPGNLVVSLHAVRAAPAIAALILRFVVADGERANVAPLTNHRPELDYPSSDNWQHCQLSGEGNRQDHRRRQTETGLNVTHWFCANKPGITQHPVRLLLTRSGACHGWQRVISQIENLYVGHCTHHYLPLSRPALLAEGLP
ncbi:hypothetical protein [Paraburkholderia bannensis]|nr:hypothetical protein [Paraburkholderia bannensis]